MNKSRMIGEMIADHDRDRQSWDFQNMIVSDRRSQFSKMIESDRRSRKKWSSPTLLQGHHSHFTDLIRLRSHLSTLSNLSNKVSDTCKLLSEMRSRENNYIFSSLLFSTSVRNTVYEQKSNYYF